MLRLLPPTSPNLKKRLVKSPKVYLRDSGILHALLDIERYDRLLAHSVAGASWEGFVMDNILPKYEHWRPSFLRTSNGAEVDLVLERGGRSHFFEFKLSKAPKPSRGFYQLVDDMQSDSAWVVAPVDDIYEIRHDVHVCPLDKLPTLSM